MFKQSNTLIYLLVISLFSACKDDDTVQTNDMKLTCENSNLLFDESESIVLVEFENAIFESDWELVTDLSNSTGFGYMMWEGENSFGTPGLGLATFRLQISQPGTYHFLWRSAVKEGTNGTEANDSWLRFPDASDFYGKKANGHIVYPKGVGKTPNPEGATSDGWFKIYRSGNDLDFKWQASTSDNDPHEIYIQFDAAGKYTMEISGRSKGHAIDKFMLFDINGFTEDEAIAHETFSVISCE